MLVLFVCLIILVMIGMWADMSGDRTVDHDAGVRHMQGDDGIERW